MSHLPKYDASQYAAFRPRYPQALYDTIYAQVNEFDMAWDCGCGNGQASIELAKRFKHVIATDISADQIEHAQPTDNIRYLVESERNTTIEDNSINLVTIAQAMHWFNFPVFKQEVQRVLRPGGVVAAWCYNLICISPEINSIIDCYANDALGAYWAPGREYLNRNYQDIPFPLAASEYTEIPLHKSLSFAELIGYLESWSPRIKYFEMHGKDIMDEFQPLLATAWGDTSQSKAATWPIHLLIGKN